MTSTLGTFLPMDAFATAILLIGTGLGAVLLVQRPTSRPRRDERGSVTLEAVIVYPVVLLVIFTVIQGAFWFHGRDTARHAATIAAAAAAAEGATTSIGEAAAADFLNQVDSLHDVSITATHAGDSVTVTVQGTTISLIPGVNWPSVTQQSTQTIERVTGP